MSQKTCNTCVYDRQHYAFDKRKLFWIFCGHCTYSKVMTRRPNSTICKNYVSGDSDENAFVAKEYLSKTLLEYMLNLELLPEIHDTKMED